jgi:hypothetical protein
MVMSARKIKKVSLLFFVYYGCKYLVVCIVAVDCLRHQRA